MQLTTKSGAGIVGILLASALYAACADSAPQPLEPVPVDGPGVAFLLFDSDGDGYSCETVNIGGFDIEICTCEDPDNVFFYSSNQCICAYSCGGGIGGPGGGGGSPPPPPPLATVEVWCAPSTHNSAPSSGVDRGQTAKCGFTKAPANAIVNPVKWTITGPDVPNNFKSGGTTWTGRVATGGMVELEWSSGSGPNQTTVPEGLVVRPRTWSWGSNKRSFGRASGSELDGCMGSGNGLAADKIGCNLDPKNLINPGLGLGFTAIQGTGMNAGVWYVTNPVTRMDVRGQVAKKFRSSDLMRTVTGNSMLLSMCQSAYFPGSVPQLNTHGVNTTCFPAPVPGFNSFVNAVWAHEDQHVALVQLEAVKPINNIYRDWEPIVETSKTDAEDAANDIQDFMHNRVRTPSALLDQPPQTVQHNFWRRLGSGGVWNLVGTLTY